MIHRVPLEARTTARAVGAPGGRQANSNPAHAITMARILIATISDDMHAAAVAHVLERMGHEPVRWLCADVPQRGTISISPHDPAGASPRVTDARGELPVSGADVFWNRRLA